MALICWYCGAKEGQSAGENENVRIDVLCHHCGKPLCERHRIEIEDSWFFRKGEMGGVHACHCKGCIRLHHSRKKKAKIYLRSGLSAIYAGILALFHRLSRSKPGDRKPEQKGIAAD